MRNLFAFAALVIAIGCANRAVAQPGPEPALQILARQDDRADFVRQSIGQLRLALENELADAAKFMRAELVGKSFFPLYDGQIGIDLRGGNECPAYRNDRDPCLDCERFESRHLEAWFAEVDRIFRVASSWQDENIQRWADARAKMRQEVQARKLEHLEQGARWREIEQAFYTEMYRLAVWQGVLVWAVQAGTIVGLDVVHLPSLKGKQQGEAGRFKFTRGPGEFGGALSVLQLDNQIATFAARVEVMHRACEREMIWRDFMAASGDAKYDLEKKVQAADSRLEQARQECRLREDAERDRFAPRFRPLRARFQQTHARLQKTLTGWRQQLIASHIYTGEGSAAIADVYGDERLVFLNEFTPLQLDLDMPYATHAFPQGGVPSFNGPSRDLNEDGASAEAACWDLAQAQIKFPDVETKPFFFALGKLGDRMAARSADSQSRVALGGRMPQEGP
jgi:hypothetical protein